MSTHFIMSVSKDMSADTGNILVFKTNIVSEREVEKLSQVLDQFIGQGTWNIDLADIDKVLRVKTSNRQVQEVIQVLREAGYFCEELPD